jgi:hypothetical protein
MAVTSPNSTGVLPYLRKICRTGAAMEGADEAGGGDLK